MSTIAELFERDPLKLTKEDRSAIIDYYRKARAQFNLGDKTAGNSKKAKSAPKISNLDIEDLL